MISAVKLNGLAVACGLAGHELLPVVLEDLRHGANIGCEGAGRTATFSKNASSALAAGEQVTDAVASWVKKGFVKGPMRLEQIPAHVQTKAGWGCQGDNEHVSPCRSECE
jgi:hypothetical protein